ncbi:uncharacterized protein Nmag_0569 [Natrialba magadii ATCC 43099]|uniref:AMP-dependent synthetase and ligase n=1 Tax=Natrialba magadii (strain ATCC 43099 / DSM 3394 / CCM 3739 / CIP 104546 / IAM 13178 / JCM 8861 / NBRC 102185 / NCIMB 2190 / MS3) TaxID=547559 RepID=D3SYP5_NATMM|nr:hypothetical protein [Natrialba magadii]ADD04156.1 uncharacterized protein Nmag_0569 [Natrialba magadii ATCC 43099]ELY32941.1 hypothetical protein C500_03254 [Natrialba magadii ATCC 43099]
MTAHVGTVDELFARDRREDRTVLVDATGRDYDAHWLCTSAWKAGNFLRHAGVREGVTVGVAGNGPVALLACFGATLLGATTHPNPPADLTDATDLQALVAPVDELESGRYDLPRGTSMLGYGEKPETPAIKHFDAGLWSENPSFPPQSLAPETGLLTDGGAAVSHAQVLESARTLIDEYEIEAGDRVVVREPLSAVEVAVAGVFAPLLVGAVTVLEAESVDGTAGEDDTQERVKRSEGDEYGTRYTISNATASESTHQIDPAELSLADRTA